MTDIDPAHLAELHETMEWEEVGAKFGLSAGAAANRVYRWRKRQRRPSVLDVSRGAVKRGERANTMVVEAQFAGIRTLEEMLEVCKVDLDVWKVDRYLINKWPIGAKAAKKDLVWEDGKLSGTIEEEGLVIAPLFQIKVWLARIVPEPMFPVVRPVECKIFKPLAVEGRKGDIRRSLVFSDPHFGFIRELKTSKLTPMHNRAALDIILQIAQIAEVHRVDVLGDTLDLAEWSSKFIRAPEFCETTQPAVLEAYWWLMQFRQCCEEMYVYEGNHGKRMQDAIIQHLRAAYDLRAADEMELPPSISVPRLLGLDSLDINWVGGYPGGGDWINDSLRITHGNVARVPGSTAKVVIESGDISEIFGHIHRIEWGSRTIHRARSVKQIVGFAPGCACWVDGRVPGYKSDPQWQNGCAILDYEVGGDSFCITPILIEDGRAIYNKESIVARDRTDDLRESYPNWEW